MLDRIHPETTDTHFIPVPYRVVKQHVSGRRYVLIHIIEKEHAVQIAGQLGRCAVWFEIGMIHITLSALDIAVVRCRLVAYFVLDIFGCCATPQAVYEVVGHIAQSAGARVVHAYPQGIAIGIKVRCLQCQRQFIGTATAIHRSVKTFA